MLISQQGRGGASSTARACHLTHLMPIARVAFVHSPQTGINALLTLCKLAWKTLGRRRVRLDGIATFMIALLILLTVFDVSCGSTPVLLPCTLQHR